MPELKYFEEINPVEFPILDKSKYPDYYVEGCESRIDRLFKYRGCYLEVYIEENIPSVSIINIGEAFSINQGKEVIDLLLRQYGKCCFTWVKGIRNEILIKRILKNYKYKIADNENICQAIFELKGE